MRPLQERSPALAHKGNILRILLSASRCGSGPRPMGKPSPYGVGWHRRRGWRAWHGVASLGARSVFNLVQPVAI